jgi:hypothetical protein
MKTRIRAIAILATMAFLPTALTLASAIPANADAYTAPTQIVPQDQAGLNVVESFSSTGEGASFLIAHQDSDKFGGMPNEYVCSGITVEGPCSFSAGYRPFSRLLMPPCDATVKTNCIDGLSIFKTGETPEAAKFIREIQGDRIAADPAHNLPAGGGKSLWSSSTLHAGGTGEYMAFVSMGLSFYGGKFSVQDFDANIQPTTTSQPGGPGVHYTQRTLDNGRTSVGGSSGPQECVWFDPSGCGKLQDFAPDTQVKMSIRISKNVGGWFKGRMKAPNVQVTSIDSENQLLSIDAQTVTVPMFFAKFAKTGNSDAVQGWISKYLNQGYVGGAINSRSDQQLAFDAMTALKEPAKDTAYGYNTLWSVGTLPGMAGNGCLADTSKVLGIVTTNSMVYQGSSPTYEQGMLNYKVAGMHFMPDGKTEVEGTYDLVMRSDTARCLYGFSKAPISATISVTSATGEAKTAVTVVKETTDGWLQLAAYGFTFSSPTIKVKVTQAQTQAPTSTKKTTITCVSSKNKKLIKKVTAAAPKCPSGYKKK